MAQYNDVQTGTIGVIGAISAILTFVIIAAAQVLYYQYQSEETQRKEVDAPITSADRLVGAQTAELNSYGWVDREKGIVSLPIERAKQEVLATMSPSTPETKP